MRIKRDGTVFEVEARQGALNVSIDKGGYDEACRDVISSYVVMNEDELGMSCSYPIAAGEVNFREAIARATSRVDSLALAQKLVALLSYRGSFKVPFIHPENVYVDGDLLRVVHCGLQGILAPVALDDAQLLRLVQAMVLQVFRPKIAFEQLLDGSKGLSDKFSRTVLQAASPEELFAFIGAELNKEKAQVLATKASVSKRRYSLYRTLGVVGVIAGLGAGYFAWQTYGQNQLQSAVVESQASFMRSDYNGALTALEGYEPGVLPASARYVLAASSVNLDDLSAKQKEAILNNISEKSDSNTLDYWIAVGRGEFEQALDRAKNLGDDQLVLFAYTGLYETTKLDSMSGSKKQELLSEYSKAIDELTAKLQGETGEAGQ